MSADLKQKGYEKDAFLREERLGGFRLGDKVRFVAFLNDRGQPEAKFLKPVDDAGRDSGEGDRWSKLGADRSKMKTGMAGANLDSIVKNCRRAKDAQPGDIIGQLVGTIKNNVTNSVIRCFLVLIKPVTYKPSMRQMPPSPRII